MPPLFLLPVIVLISCISLTGCVLTPIPQPQNKDGSSSRADMQAIADMKLGELLNYQQQDYQLEDPLGDHALLVFLQLTAPDVFWLTLSGQGYGELFDDINKWRRGFNYESIGLDRFQGMREKKPVACAAGYRETWSKDVDVFMPVIVQEQKKGVTPTTGICHRWSSAYRHDPQTFTFPYLFFSKLFWALAYGDSSVYFITGHEETLAQWIVSQKHRSVSLQQVFRKSYQLNGGDVYLSLLTATNVFSRFWYVNDRENLAIATRLKLITTRQHGEGDNFGAWHHFWGMVLFGYCHGETSARLVGWIESMGSSRVTQQDEIDEKYINRHAGPVGTKLRQNIEDWRIE